MTRHSKRSSSADDEQQPSRKRLRMYIVPKSDDEESNKNVRVVARVRPLSVMEADKRSVVTSSNTSILIENGDSRNYDYDAVFGPESTQIEVYQQSGAKDAVCKDILQGFNCTILAYGQTGSGKTFTMGTASAEENDYATPREMDGIIPRAVYDLFETIEKDKSKSVTVEMSFLEIYNEEARDLLAEPKGENQNLVIREGPNGGVFVQNLTWKPVSSHQVVTKHIQSASDRRVTASTQMNAVSSRSHAISTLQVKIKTLSDDGTTKETKSKLTLVDLAGSERLKRTGAEGSRLKEGININKGLFVLGQVVSCLSQLGERQSPSPSTSPQHHHIPYRDSKLTRLLQDSLGGNSRTIMVACVSPADSNAEESINTLRYASRARNIQNSAIKNIIEAAIPPEAAAALRRENQSLRQRVIQLEAQLRKTHSPPDGPNLTYNAALESIAVPHDCNVVKTLQGKVASLRCKLDRFQDQVKRSAQDALEATLQADHSKLQYEEIIALAKTKGVELASMYKASGGTTMTDGGSASLIQQLRHEISEWKLKEAEARTDAEIARATATSIISTTSGDYLTAEMLVPPTGDDQDEEEEKANEQEALLASELLSVNGSIAKKEEIVKKALLEKQRIEAMKFHFEGALQNLQTEVETLSVERENLFAIVESIPEDKAGTTLMKSRINALEKRIEELQKKASEHQKSLRLRELAEKRVNKLELEIRNDKKRKAELQKKLKEESVERRKDKKAAKLQASRLLKDSNRLKFELQKVKSAAERQAMVLRRKTTALLNKQKHQHQVEQRKRKHVANGGKLPSTSTRTSFGRRSEIISWLNREIDASKDMAATGYQIIDQEFLLEETLQKIKNLESNGDSSSKRLLEEEAETRGAILDQLRQNLQTMKDASSSGLKEVSAWNDMSLSEKSLVLVKTLEKVGNLHNDDSKKKHEDVVDKAVAAAKAEERQKCEESVLKLRLEHSEAMSTLLESTRMALENEIKRKVATDSTTAGSSVDIDRILKEYFNVADVAAESIKNEMEQVKSHRDGMRNAVNQLAKDITSHSESATTKNPKKKKKRKSSMEEYEALDESFVLELDDGNDSDWSPDDDMVTNLKIKNNNKSSSISLAKTEVSSAIEESSAVIGATLSTESLESLKVAELKERLREYGLKLSGKKSQLKSRLEDYINLQHSSQHSTKQYNKAQPRKPLQPIENNVNNASFMKDNSSFSAKRREITDGVVKRRRRRNMNNAVTAAMVEVAKL